MTCSKYLAATQSAPRVEPAVDGMLKLAETHGPHQAFMFDEQVSSTCPETGDLVITSAQDAEGKPTALRVLPGTLRVFRADQRVDEFTGKGGWYWRCGDVQGKLQFAKPGALIVVVRGNDGTVHWYSLQFDFRC